MFFKNSNDLLKALFPIPEESLEQGMQLLNETGTDIEEFRQFFYWMLMGKGYRAIDLDYTGLAFYFFCYASDKLSHDFAPYVLNKPDLKVEQSFMDYILSGIHTLVDRGSPLGKPEHEWIGPIEEMDIEPETDQELELQEEDDTYDLFWDLNINNDYLFPYYELDNMGSFAIPFDERLKEFMKDFEEFVDRVPEEKQTKLFKWLINQVYEDFGRQYGIKKKEKEKHLKFRVMLPAAN